MTFVPKTINVLCRNSSFQHFKQSSILQCLYIVLQGELVYEAYGDGAALYYFAITSSGQIYVRNSLQGVTQGVYNVSTHYRYNCSITTCKDKAENIG